jgi:hypothetical protein
MRYSRQRNVELKAKALTVIRASLVHVTDLMIRQTKQTSKWNCPWTRSARPSGSRWPSRPRTWASSWNTQSFSGRECSVAECWVASFRQVLLRRGVESRLLLGLLVPQQPAYKLLVPRRSWRRRGSSQSAILIAPCWATIGLVSAMGGKGFSNFSQIRRLTDIYWNWVQFPSRVSPYQALFTPDHILLEIQNNSRTAQTFPLKTRGKAAAARSKSYN